MNLHDAFRKLDEAETLIKSAQRAYDQAKASVVRAIEERVKEGLKAFETDAYPATEHRRSHRRSHRPGRPPKIDTAPEQQAFSVARIDRMTFVQIAEDVARHFPKERRIGRSSFHAWWTKNRATVQ